MKILIATPYFHPTIGGLETYALEIARGLRAAGWEVVIVCGDAGVRKVTRETLFDLTVYRLPIWKIISNTPVHPGWLSMLRKIIRTEKPDIINAHTPVPYMVDMIALASGRVPLVVTYHAATLFKPSSLTMRVVTTAYLMAQSLTLTKAKAIIAVSPYVKDTLSKRLREKSRVIPNAVNPITSQPTQRSGLVFVASLEPTHAWKGLDLILDALAIAANDYHITPHLTIIGDGGDRSRYEQRTVALGLKRQVTFTGRLVPTERDEVVSRASVQINYPTTANDAMPTVLLEGWAQGLPVIAARIGAIPSIVEHGKTGIVVDPNDPNALAKGICDLVSNPEEILAMGNAAKEIVSSKYSWPLQVKRTSRLLELLI